MLGRFIICEVAQIVSCFLTDYFIINREFFVNINIESGGRKSKSYSLKCPLYNVYLYIRGWSEKFPT